MACIGMAGREYSMLSERHRFLRLTGMHGFLQENRERRFAAAGLSWFGKGRIITPDTYGTLCCRAPLAQLDRASVYGTEG